MNRAEEMWVVGGVGVVVGAVVVTVAWAIGGVVAVAGVVVVWLVAAWRAAGRED